MNEPKKFFNQTQPQTLQIGVMLLYINAVFKVLGGWIAWLPGLVLVAALAFGGYGIANEQKWGYQVGVGAAVVNLLLTLVLIGRFDNPLYLLGVIFDGALVALLLHPMSREYQKIWFR